MDFGRYTKKRRLTGQGAQGDLWLAEDSSNNNNRVALKILRSSNETDLERFRREARCAYEIVSPNVARIWDWGSDPEPFIAFEYVDGRDLGTIVPIRSMAEYLRVSVGIVAGLRAIHDEGIAHRDIKPENVRYEGDGHVKIVDLGIALSRGESRMTEVASVPGTYGWMAPERRSKGPLGVEAEQKADIFSTGLLLAFLRTKRHPYAFDQNRIDAAAIEPDLESIQEEYIVEIIKRALATNPDDRPTARGMLEALRESSQFLPVPRSNRRKRRLLQLSGGLVAVLLVIDIGIRVMPDGPTSPFPSTLPTRPTYAVQACTPGQYNRASQGDAVLRFGALLPDSGPLAAQGPSQFAALRMALSDVRETGGAPFSIESLKDENLTDEGDATEGTACDSTAVLLSNGVDVIIGPSSSAVAEKTIDRVVESGVIMFSPANTAPSLTDRTDGELYFRTAPSDTLQGSVLGKIIVDDGSKTAAVLARNDLYGDGLRREVTTALRAGGVEVLASENYGSRAKYEQVTKKLRVLNPDAIVLIGFAETATILQEMIRARIGPGDKHVYGADGNMRRTLVGQVDPNNQGVIAGMKGTRLPPEDIGFTDRLNAFDGGGLVEFAYAAEVYDAVIIASLAAVIAGTDNPANISREINSVTQVGEPCNSYLECLVKVRENIDIDYNGVSGNLEFNDAGEPCVADYVVSEFNDEGILTTELTAVTSNRCVTFQRSQP